MGAEFPDFGPLAYLVFQAVMQVIFPCVAGFLVCYSGKLAPQHQKFLADINLLLFMPCLVFIKLASQLTPDKLTDSALIPVMFVVQTCIAWTAAWMMTKLFRYTKKESNFVTAMAVFGNSNSLPVSLVISLAHTIPSLYWLEKFPDDNAESVAARGIFYLLIFQQLGQSLRLTWGYNVLLAPNQEGKPMYEDEEDNLTIRIPTPRIVDETDVRTPLLSAPHAGVSISAYSSTATLYNPRDQTVSQGDKRPTKVQVLQAHVKEAVLAQVSRLPVSIQTVLRFSWSVITLVCVAIWKNTNAPLWALVCAMIVASVPPLRATFFTPGTFVCNTLTASIRSISVGSVPISLIVLGANICKSVCGSDQGKIKRPIDEDYFGDNAMALREKASRDNRLIIGSILARMVIPTIMSSPILMFVVWHARVGILQDPIFVVVCFLLIGAPTALMLSTICQKNDVYMDTMSKILVHGYVTLILPSTMILVSLAMVTLKWARQSPVGVPKSSILDFQPFERFSGHLVL